MEAHSTLFDDFRYECDVLSRRVYSTASGELAFFGGAHYFLLAQLERGFRERAAVPFMVRQLPK